MRYWLRPTLKSAHLWSGLRSLYFRVVCSSSVHGSKSVMRVKPFLAYTELLTARFSVIDPHRMMQTYGLTDGFIRTGMITLSYGQVSVNATRCQNPVMAKFGDIASPNFREHLFHALR